MKGGGIVVAVIALPMAIVLGLVLAITSMGSGNANACAPSAAGTINAAAIPADAKVAGFGAESLVYAAAIINAASAMGLPAAAQTLGVQTAIGESTLQNLTYGDNAINPDGSVADSIGLFQQQGSWGTVEERMDPPTAARLFFERLVNIPGWEQLEPSIAINSVQINADPYYYVPFRAAATEITDYLAKLGGASGSACSVSGDAKQVAQQLQTAMDNGSLVVAEGRYAEQITNMANGTAAEGCTIDLRILQFIALAVQKFESVGVSDLNRHCTGSLEGAGTGSAHYFKGGGFAVDFYSINGSSLGNTGADNLALLDLLSSVAPDGTRAGQINCRSGQEWPHIVQFEDTCNHQHIDFGYTDGQLNVTK
jgi:hypothetical protein